MSERCWPRVDLYGISVASHAVGRGVCQPDRLSCDRLWVLWSMALLGERYSFWVWVALVLMLIGLTLVRPVKTALAQATPPGDTA